jgi:hypothetical protein
MARAASFNWMCDVQHPLAWGSAPNAQNIEDEPFVHGTTNVSLGWPLPGTGAAPAAQPLRRRLQAASSALDGAASALLSRFFDSKATIKAGDSAAEGGAGRSGPAPAGGEGSPAGSASTRPPFRPRRPGENLLDTAHLTGLVSSGRGIAGRHRARHCGTPADGRRANCEGSAVPALA